MTGRGQELRVAHLTAGMAVGGKERTIADLCRTAPGVGIEPVILMFDASPDVGWPLGDVPVLAFDRRCGRRALARQLSTVLRERQVDLLHAHGHVAAIHAADAARRMPVATVATMHMTWRDDWRWLPSIIRALRRIDRVVAVSRDLADDYGRLSRSKVGVVPTGVELSRFAVPAVPIVRHQSPCFTVGMAGRPHPVKRYRDAVEAVRLLTDDGLPVRLLVAGFDDAAQLGPVPPGVDVRLLGRVDDMPGFYASLDAFLIGSDHEGAPLVLLEAMASGVPCVATSVGGIPDIADDGDGPCVCLVPSRRPQAIASALRDLSEQPALRTELVRRATGRVRHFSLEAQAAAYAALYAEAIASARLR